MAQFDPLKFLNITNLKNQDKKTVEENLLNKISQYVLIRIIGLLPKEEINKTITPEIVIRLAQEKIPDLNQKINFFMSDFKKEFNKNLKN
jgi:hypothetical protein